MTDRAKSETPETPPRLVRNECGAFNIRIDREGRWYYENSPIGRLPLVKLFSTVLSRDENGVYWLTTPAEHGTIEVEDAPFVAVEMVVEGTGESQEIRLRTNIDEWITVDAEHPLWLEEGGRVEHDAAGGPTPYVRVRDGLDARVARAVYYDLVAMAVEEKGGAAAPSEKCSPEEGVIGVWSKGQFFPLGSFSDET